jgi:DNA-binding NarL/FixJ family response regulator
MNTSMPPSARPQAASCSRTRNPPTSLRQVLVAVARGLSNAEIGDALYMSAATAKTHVGRLLTKLNARDRTQLVIAAYEADLVDR